MCAVDTQLHETFSNWPNHKMMFNTVTVTKQKQPKALKVGPNKVESRVL